MTKDQEQLLINVAKLQIATTEALAANLKISSQDVDKEIKELKKSVSKLKVKNA